MRIIDADKIRQRLNPDDWGTPDERWRPEREFGELIDQAPTVDQWHYPSKGEYPTKGEEMLCKVTDPKKMFEWYQVGVWDNKHKDWVFAKSEKFSEVLAWQYIVPPQEET